MGLAIAQRKVVHLGGELLVESAPGEGSCFRFEIPLIVDPAAGSQEAG